VSIQTKTCNADGRWVHPLCESLPIHRNGPFVELADGSLMTIDSQGMRVSTDDGAPWSEARPVCEGLNDKEPSSHRVVRMKSDVLTMVYLNFTILVTGVFTRNEYQKNSLSFSSSVVNERSWVIPPKKAGPEAQ